MDIVFFSLSPPTERCTLHRREYTFYNALISSIYDKEQSNLATLAGYAAYFSVKSLFLLFQEQFLSNTEIFRETGGATLTVTVDMVYRSKVHLNSVGFRDDQ